LQQQQSTLDALDVRIAVVTFQASRLALASAAELKLTWPILIDDPRALYHAYGMTRGRPWDVYGPAAWWVYFKEALRGVMPRATRADTRQLGGDVLIDPDGIVRFHHIGRGPADRPQVSAILAARA
jgi:hypothetical protein